MADPMIKAALTDVFALSSPNDKHCAFTTLTRHNDIYYVAYREALGHDVGPDSRIVIQQSRDADTWHPWKELQYDAKRMDVRDPRFFIPGPRQGEMGLLVGAYTPLHWAALNYRGEGNALSTWVITLKRGVWSWQGLACAPGHWLWSTIEEGIVRLGASYLPGGEFDPNMIWLFVRPHGQLRWRMLHGTVEGTHLSEPLLFTLHDTQWPYGCFIRTIKNVLFLAFNPRSWQQKRTFLPVHAHLSAIVPYTPNRWIVAGRQVGSHPWVNDTTALWLFEWTGKVEEARLTPLLTLPSKADCGYAGLTWLNDDRTTLLVSYYSQHEVKSPASKVYIAHVNIHDLA